MAISTLLQAIKSHWYSDTTLTGLVTGGLYLSQVPEKKGSTRLDLPYGVVEVGVSKFGWTFSTMTYEVADLAFIVMTAGSMNNMETIATAIHNRFDWCYLPFDDGLSATTYFQPLDDDYSAEPVKYRDGSLVYRTTLRYESFSSRVNNSFRTRSTTPTTPPPE